MDRDGVKKWLAERTILPADTFPLAAHVPGCVLKSNGVIVFNYSLKESVSFLDGTSLPGVLSGPAARRAPRVTWSHVQAQNPVNNGLIEQFRHTAVPAVMLPAAKSDAGPARIGDFRFWCDLHNGGLADRVIVDFQLLNALTEHFGARAVAYSPFRLAVRGRQGDALGFRPNYFGLIIEPEVAHDAYVQEQAEG